MRQEISYLLPCTAHAFSIVGVCRGGNIGTPELFIAQNRDTDAVHGAGNSDATATSLATAFCVCRI